MLTKETVGNPNETIQIKPGFEVFFKQIIYLVNNMPMNEQLGEELKNLALTFPFMYDLRQFDIFSDNHYERTYLGKDESGWEAIIMTWRKGRQSSIHGHPQFASYTILKGNLKLELFDYFTDTGEIKLARIIEATENTGFFALGEANTMTNHIHRITCMSDISYSLHIYSNDARKGVVYRM